MKKLLFLCRTPIHVLRTIQLKFELYEHSSVDICIFDSFKGSDKIIERINNKSIFDYVLYVSDSDYMYDGKFSDLVSYIKKSNYKKFLKSNIYDELFTYDIFGQFNEIAYNVLRKNNSNLVYNMMEDGPTLYYVERIDSKTKKYLYTLFGLKNSLDYIDNWWFSRPDLMTVFGNGIKKSIPKVDKNNLDMIKYMNYVFDYKDSEDIRNADIMFMEECFCNDGLLKDSKDLRIFKGIKSAIENVDCVVKIHPRSVDNRFDGDFKVLPNDGIPWELFALNMDVSKKIMVSIACTTMISSSMLFGEESFSLMLYPMFINDIIDLRKKTPYFNGDRVEKLLEQTKVYKNPERIQVAESTDEAIEIIKKWIEIIKNNNG
ncbi:MAG: hypothetical protein IJV15_14350 [Lachnospiraceae bacterium]|nr:hypothetical protein [Lachnospiraceae bacterium]